MLASNRDEWANRLNEEWNEQLNCAKNNTPNDETCKKNQIEFINLKFFL